MIKSNDEQGLSDYLNWINIDNKFRDSIPVNITEKQDIPFGKISGFEIAKQIANVRHILFEVTDSCSLRCTYCGYGEFYEDHDQRLNTNLPTKSAKLFLDY